MRWRFPKRTLFGTLYIMRWRYPKRTLYCYIIVCIGFHGYFKKIHLFKKNTYYHGVIFVVFFQLKVDIVYFYGFGAVLHLIF